MAKAKHILGGILDLYKIFSLKGQSHEKVGEMSVWGISLGPN
jgi:hypothetical protein